ncbi:MAG: TonB-dependent receptor [Gemmatimonadetes bacterium]|nr:TonB-dependent receptor [Gemmatimonadota bacterium]
MHNTVKSLRRAPLWALLLTLALPNGVLAAPSDLNSPAVIGTVVDSAGAPLANANVIVAEVSRATTTNAQGEFVLRGLPAGEYHLSVTLIGYAPGHRVVRVLADGQDVRVRIALVPTPLRLNSVIVSASPTGTETDRLTQAAVELSGRALSRSLGSSVASTLAQEPGVSQRFNGPAATMPVIRGLTGDRILVLQDGERSGDLASAAGDHTVSVDPLAAQRIEVVRGPASLLYGNNALGGVVNVVSNDIPTSVPTHFEGNVGSQSESVTPGGALSAAITTGVGARGALTVRGGWREMGALRTGGATALDGTDSRAINAAVGYGYVGERANAGLAVKAYDFDYGIPSAPGDPEAGIRIDGRRAAASARSGIQLPGAALPYLRIETTVQHYTHDEIESDGAIGTNFQLRTQTLNAQATTAFGRLKGALGLQGLFKQYAATGEEALTPAANSSGLGAFVYQELPLHRDTGDDDADHEGEAQLQFGARWDDYSIASRTGEPKFGAGRTSDFSKASGSLGISVPLGKVLSVSGSVARAFRAPTVEELYSNAFHAAAGTYDIGNASLQAETSAGAEVIVRARTSRVTAQFSAYSNRIADYVTPNIVGDTLVDGDLVPLNRFAQADARLTGIEGMLETRLGPSVVASVSGDLVRGEFDAGGALPFMPPARVGGGLRWERGRFSLAGDVRHAFAQDRVTGGSVDVATEAYTLLNLSAGTQWVVGNVLHGLTLRGDNVGDVRYFDSASRIKSFAPNPGRNISLVYQVRF